MTAPVVPSSSMKHGEYEAAVLLDGESLKSEVGGKAAQLGALIGAGVDVPPAIALPASLFINAVKATNCTDLDQIRSKLLDDDTAADSSLLSAAVSRDVARFLGKQQQGRRRFGVACRSSAASEDGAAASFAGQFESVLNLKSADAVCKAVLKVWASAFSEASLTYLKRQGGEEDMSFERHLELLAMGVVLQRQVDSAKAGVLFTANPRTGNQRQQVVEAVFGQGEGLVSGEITPDYYWTELDDKKQGSVRFLRERRAKRHVGYFLGDDGLLKTVDISSAAKYQCRVLSRNQLVELSAMGLKVALAMKCGACDVEWAVDSRGKLWALQARRITSKAPACQSDALEYLGPWAAPNEVSMWQRDGHAVRPLPPIRAREWFGIGDALVPVLHACGVGLANLHMACVNGMPYTSITPLGAPDPTPSGPPPPGPILYLLSRLHPKLRAADRVAAENLRRATAIFDDDLKKIPSWLELAREWREKEQPTRVKNAEAIRAVDPSSLVDDDLVKHIAECVSELDVAWRSHGKYTPATIIPVTLFVATFKDVLPKQELFALTLDHRRVWEQSPARPLFEAFENAPSQADEAREILKAACDSRDEALASAALKKLMTDDGLGEAVRCYVLAVEDRVLGSYDFTALTPREQPLVLAEMLFDAATKPVLADCDTAACSLAVAKIAALTWDEKKGQDRKAVFSKMLEHCREISPMRDQRGYNNDAWINGLLRRALLVAGDRLYEAGRLAHRDDVLWLDSTEEIAELLSNTMQRSPERSLTIEPVSGVEKMAAKASALRRHADNFVASADAPEFLNLPASGLKPKDPDFKRWMPKGLGSVTAAFVAGFHAIMDGDDDEHGNDCEAVERHNLAPNQTSLQGYAASSGTYTAKARVMRSFAEFPLLEKGEIAVLPATNASFNAYLGRCGAIVTDSGGVLCHAALCAREAHIPAVVGCCHATSQIKTGTMLTVDGDTATVKIHPPGHVQVAEQHADVVTVPAADVEKQNTVPVPIDYKVLVTSEKGGPLRRRSSSSESRGYMSSKGP